MLFLRTVHLQAHVTKNCQWYPMHDGAHSTHHHTLNCDLSSVFIAYF